MFKATFTIVIPDTAVSGKGMSKSPKRAVAQAQSNAWDALVAHDRQFRCCSSIGMEWLHLSRNGVKICSQESHS
jgi:hypothetical protein